MKNKIQVNIHRKIQFILLLVFQHPSGSVLNQKKTLYGILRTMKGHFCSLSVEVTVFLDKIFKLFLVTLPSIKWLNFQKSTNITSDR